MTTTEVDKAKVEPGTCFLTASAKTLTVTSYDRLSDDIMFRELPTDNWKLVDATRVLGLRMIEPEPSGNDEATGNSEDATGDSAATA